MMKKIVIILGVFLCVTGCDILTKNKSDNYKSQKKSLEEEVELKLNSMSIEEKIAQMLILYYTKDSIDDNLLDILKTYNPGGFIITKDNITTYEKTKKFILDLQKNSDIPMIISMDQEGGNVQRLQLIEDIKPTYIPFMYYLGKTQDEKLAYDVGKVMAEQLRTLGVNVAFAPVLDVFSNLENTVIGKRSFGTDPSIVSNMARNFAKGLEDNGVVATYKHFPGHGDTAVDSHYNLPIINKSYDELKKVELKPFIDAIHNKAKIIMVGHLSLPNITNDSTPATLSKKIITDILYDDLNYRGLVITDALNMQALTKEYSEEDIYIMAINAGVDLLLMPNGSKKAIEIIKNNISEDRINQSVKKILTFKYQYLSNYQYLDKSYLNNEQQEEVIKKIEIKD